MGDLGGNVNAAAFCKSKKTATHPCSGLLSAHAPQHLRLRLLSTLLLYDGEYMYALQKHRAKILFFYFIKKSFRQIFQQFIEIVTLLQLLQGTPPCNGVTV